MSLSGTVSQIHPKICTPLPQQTDSNSAKPFFAKIEAQLSAIKCYVNCKILALHSKIKLIPQNLPETIKVFQERETKTN